jgi:hypothetical protein
MAGVLVPCFTGNGQPQSVVELPPTSFLPSREVSVARTTKAPKGPSPVELEDVYVVE